MKQFLCILGMLCLSGMAWGAIGWGTPQDITGDISGEQSFTIRDANGKFDTSVFTSVLTKPISTDKLRDTLTNMMGS